MKRNYSIDVIKLAFSLFIALGHGGIELVSSNMIVHCFFALSGFFLVTSYDSGKYNADSICYIKKRLVEIYPYYITSLILYLSILWWKEKYNFIGLFDRLGKILPEAFLLQNTGFLIRGGINYPCWQLSALIISSYIMFGLISWNRKLTVTVISPCLVLFGFAYWENIFNSHAVHSWGVEHGFFYVPLIRAFSSLCLGIWLHDIITEFIKWLDKENIHAIWLAILTVVSMLYYYVNNNHTQAFFGFWGLVICCMTSKGFFPRLFNKKIFHICGKLSLAIYFNHAILLELIGRDTIPLSSNIPKSILLFWGCLTLLSICYLIIINRIIKKFKIQQF